MTSSAKCLHCDAFLVLGLPLVEKYLNVYEDIFGDALFCGTHSDEISGNKNVVVLLCLLIYLHAALHGM